MVGTVALIALLLLMAVVATAIFRRLPVPDSVVLVIAGVALGEAARRWPPLTPAADLRLSPELVFFVLLLFATAMLIAALVFLVMLVGFNRRMAQIERAGIQVNSLLISREENTVYLNNLGFKLTDAAVETMSVLAEARMDDDVLSGSEIEAVISGRSAVDCDEAAGSACVTRLATRLSRSFWSRTLPGAAICLPSTRTSSRSSE